MLRKRGRCVCNESGDDVYAKDAVRRWAGRGPLDERMLGASKRRVAYFYDGKNRQMIEIHSRS